MQLQGEKKMADKRYYWLKLKEDYFNSPKIKKLRKIAGGDTYTIIYLKMQLLSIKNNGIIEFEKIEPTFQEELALKLDEDVENVGITLSYLQTQGLIEVNNNNEFLLLEANDNIGSESESAKRVRLFREREDQKALQCNGSVTEVKQTSISISNSNSNNINNTSKEKEEKEKLEEPKHRYGEYQNVYLKDSEVATLNKTYGEDRTKEAIKYLDEYIEMKGYKAKSHYLAIRKWVFNALKREEKEKNPQQTIDYSDMYTEEQLKRYRERG